MTHIRKHERPTTTAAGGGLLLRLLRLLLLLSAATDVVRATEVYAPDCQAMPDGYSSRVGTGCTQYVYCQGGVVTSTYNCPVGTIYNGRLCDWAANVDCATTTGATTTDTTTTDTTTTGATTTDTTTTDTTTTGAATTDTTTTDTTTTDATSTTTTTTASDSSFEAGFLCGNSLTELETTCGTAKNCFSDPCPPETPFCFPFQCNKTGDASTATTMSTNTAATTTAARFLCANSLAELETTCGTAKNCFSDPCPSEAPFCFPFQCTMTNYASTAATMTTTTAATSTATTTTTEATTTTDTTTTDTTTTEISTTAATTTADEATTDTTTTETTTTQTSTTVADVVRATEVYAPDCQATPDGYSSRVGTGCTQYVYCQGGVVTSTYNCPVGTIYNGRLCDWAANVDCATTTGARRLRAR